MAFDLRCAFMATDVIRFRHGFGLHSRNRGAECADRNLKAAGEGHRWVVYRSGRHAGRLRSGTDHELVWVTAKSPVTRGRITRPHASASRVESLGSGDR